MFNRTNLLFAYYGLVGVKNIYKNIKKENKKDKITEDLIDSVISENIELSKKPKKKYSLEKIKINRKIPDKEELNEIFNDFIKNNKIIKAKNNNLNNYYYEKIYKNLDIYNNNYFNYDFLLQRGTYYKILINLNLKKIKNGVKLLFLMSDDIKSIKYELKLNNNNSSISIIFNNIFFEDDKNINLYLIFKHFNYDLLIENISLHIYKNENISKKNPILIINKEIYKQYLFCDSNIFNLRNSLINF